MTIDFYAEYKNYSNAELLRIVRQRDEYQSQAVEAATKVLERRQVSEEEIKSVDDALQDLAFAKQYESERFGRLKAKTAELFSPVFQPHENIEPSKWLNFLLLVIGIEYVWMLFGASKGLIRIFSHRHIWWGQFIDLVPVVYIPIIFYLLFKRRRWGWILLFADNLGTLIFLLSELPIVIKYVAPNHGEIVPYFSWIPLRGAFAVFLWRDMIAGLFGVDATTKKRTIIGAVAGTLLLMGAIYLLL